MPSHWNQVTPEDIRRGAIMKAYREDAGLSAREVGEAARISAQYLYMIENGHRAAPAKTCRKIAAALKIDVAEITDPAYDKRPAPRRDVAENAECA
jgi:transcriptional regulator with XRE-family HTH domain